MKPNDMIENPCGPISAGQSEREAASRLGQKRYTSTTPCRRGHVGERYVSTGACIECLRRFKNGVGGPRADSVNRPQLRNIIIGVPYEWGQIWTQAHQDAATVYLQQCADAMLAEWSKPR